MLKKSKMPLEGHWRKSKENRHKLEVETGVRLIPLFIFNEQSDESFCDRFPDKREDPCNLRLVQTSGEFNHGLIAASCDAL